MTQSAASDAGKGRWEHFPHDADVGVRGFGATPAEAFEQAAMALTAVVTQAQVKPKVRVDVACEAPDLELLFVEWLNAIIYEMAVRGMIFSRFEVSLQNGKLDGLAWGEALDTSRHTPAVEPKGATMTGLKVEQVNDGTWTAECIVDV